MDYFLDYFLAQKTKTIQKGVGERAEHVEHEGEFEDKVAFGNASEEADHPHGQGQITEHVDQARAADVREKISGGVRRRRCSAFCTYQRDRRIFIFQKLP